MKKVKEKELNKYSLEELLLLSQEIQQIINNKDFPIDKITFEESKEIAISYKKDNNLTNLRNNIEIINNFIVMKNKDTTVDNISNRNKLNELMNDDNKNVRFIITNDSSGAYSFKLIKSDKVLLCSENYSRLESCKKGISAFKKGIIKENSKFEIYQDKNNYFRFRLKASNGELLAVSIPYATKKECLKSIKEMLIYSQVAETVVL